MLFKEPRIEFQYCGLPVLLRLIAEDFERISKEFGIDPVVTRVSDPVEGESGVHRDNRALDIRDEFGGKYTYSLEQRAKLLTYINHKYARNDGLQTMIWHSFAKGPHHFHLQIARLTTAYAGKVYSNG